MASGDHLLLPRAAVLLLLIYASTASEVEDFSAPLDNEQLLTASIAAVAEYNHRLARNDWNETLRLFIKMTEEGIDYESSTMVPLFNLCASLPALEVGKMLCSIVLKRCFSYNNAAVDSVIVDMSWKLNMEKAKKSFDSYKQMKNENLKPNVVTFLSLISASRHNGLVEKELNCFISLVLDHGIEPCAEHDSRMVDLLGRAGFLEEAIELIDKMPLEAEVST
ncbi:Pentatricopeptide repeat-containing protein [Apostasia shenzhenica]|uniref:Pentatricopeptide repeat-containing protein n=1 Tax=Apostasia shenzhenica TaxID=1088818 RepID=A0A2I0AJ82_9ASPA|nr:Pentatricopeptide repeat-containing protein [Apostasia shenzhenica]